jgi:hypothetical protein
VDGYTVNYGTTPIANQYSAHFDGQANGVLAKNIGALAKNGNYYFRVQATNGCTAGPWSNTVVSVGGKKRSFMTTIIQVVNKGLVKVGAKPINTNSVCTGNWCRAGGASATTTPEPSSAPSYPDAATPVVTPAPAAPLPPTANPSWLQKVGNFFGKLRGR